MGWDGLTSEGGKRVVGQQESQPGQVQSQVRPAKSSPGFGERQIGGRCVEWNVRALARSLSATAAAAAARVRKFKGGPPASLQSFQGCHCRLLAAARYLPGSVPRYVPGYLFGVIGGEYLPRQKHSARAARTPER
jgi:hypothetical protein